MSVNEEFKEELARSLEATPELLPFIPELVSDLWALGSSPEKVVELLHPLGLSPKTTKVLDLGCGKGAVGITLAREFGFHILGVDGCKPFIKDAKKRSEESGVGKLCQFICMDMRKIIKIVTNTIKPMKNGIVLTKKHAETKRNPNMK